MKLKVEIVGARTPPAEGQNSYARNQDVRVAITLEGARGEPIVTTLQAVTRQVETTLRETFRS